MAIELQQVPQSAKHRAWRYFLTGDESRFYYTIDHDHTWIPGGEEVPTRPTRMETSPKRLLIVFWSPFGFSLVEILPKGIHCDSQYFCSNILSEIVQNRPSDIHENRRRRMVVHFDNTDQHTAKCMIDYLRANRLKRASHPDLSPNLAPSDFHLFGKLKMALMVQHLPTKTSFCKV
jgi:hypothetical protein